MPHAIVWFRKDLRCLDNPAFSAACEQQESIIPLYIYDPNSLFIGKAQQWWLYHSLKALDNQLGQHRLSLCLQKGEPLSVLKALIQNHQISDVYWNHCYEPSMRKQEQKIQSCLEQNNISLHSFPGNLLNEPWEIKNQNGGYYKVFSPYWKQALKKIQVKEKRPISQWPKAVHADSDDLNDWQLLPKNPDWAAKFIQYWQPGEQGAKKQLDHFLNHHLATYKTQRDFPAMQATSRLSPHLHFGEISPQYVWKAVQYFLDHGANNTTGTADSFLAEIGWREFAHHLFYHYPELAENNFKQNFDKFPWENDEKLLQAWQKGQTGYPIVDAGMRELWHTGYMHNRVRMISASFLTKDLFIDWRKGADWFFQTLLDADVANNAFNWQWIAGSGADAVPYFRIFNPVLQAERFDKQGEYIKQWVPELSKVDNRWIHKPWEAPENELPIQLGKDYPNPLVIHKEAREKALNAYKKINAQGVS